MNEELQPTLNKANIDRLIRKLESINKAETKIKREFIMGCWYEKNECGTVGCLGGWASTMIAKSTNIITVLNVSPREVADWLGMPHDDAHNMLHMYYSGMALIGFDLKYDHSARINIAILMLQNLKKTGVADWRMAVDWYEEKINRSKRSK